MACPAVVLFSYHAWQTHLRVIHPPAEELARQIAARLSFPSNVDELTQASAWTVKETTSFTVIRLRPL